MKNTLQLALAISLFMLLTAVTPQAQTPAPTFVPCTSGGLMWGQTTSANSLVLPFHCVDPRSVFPPPMVTGGPCSPPAAGTTIYALLPDKSCYPLVAIAASGGIASVTPLTLARVGR